MAKQIRPINQLKKVADVQKTDAPLEQPQKLTLYATPEKLFLELIDYLKKQSYEGVGNLLPALLKNAIKLEANPEVKKDEVVTS